MGGLDFANVRNFFISNVGICRIYFVMILVHFENSLKLLMDLNPVVMVEGLGASLRNLTGGLPVVLRASCFPLSEVLLGESTCFFLVWCSWQIWLNGSGK